MRGRFGGGAVQPLSDYYSGRQATRRSGLGADAAGARQMACDSSASRKSFPEFTMGIVPRRSRRPRFAVRNFYLNLGATLILFRNYSSGLTLGDICNRDVISALRGVCR